MLRRVLLVLALVSPLIVAVARGDDHVAVPGSSVQYPTTITQEMGGGKVAKMRVTGTALRKRLTFSVYAIASYVDENAKVGSAEELAGADVAKELYLVLERDVDGKDMASAFTDAIRKNYPGDAFADEINQLTGLLQGNTAKKGDRVLLLHVPGKGLYCLHMGKKDAFIANPAFSKAVWDIYFGKSNIGEEVKRGLVSKL